MAPKKRKSGETEKHRRNAERQWEYCSQQTEQWEQRQDLGDINSKERKWGVQKRIRNDIIGQRSIKNCYRNSENCPPKRKHSLAQEKVMGRFAQASNISKQKQSNRPAKECYALVDNSQNFCSIFPAHITPVCWYRLTPFPCRHHFKHLLTSLISHCPACAVLQASIFTLPVWCDVCLCDTSLKNKYVKFH